MRGNGHRCCSRRLADSRRSCRSAAQHIGHAQEHLVRTHSHSVDSRAYVTSSIGPRGASTCTLAHMLLPQSRMVKTLSACRARSCRFSLIYSGIALNISNILLMNATNLLMYAKFRERVASWCNAMSVQSSMTTSKRCGLRCSVRAEKRGTSFHATSVVCSRCYCRHLGISTSACSEALDDCSPR